MVAMIHAVLLHKNNFVPNFTLENLENGLNNINNIH